MSWRPALALMAVTALPAGPAESAAADLLESLAGHWQGAGEMRGMPAELRMTWEPVLDGRFTRLTMDNVMQGPEGRAWHFKAQAFYRAAEDGRIDGTWFDSRGAILPLAGSIGNDTLTVLWGTEDAERGRSRYRTADGVLEVTDEVDADGTWRVFGRTRLVRAPAR